MNKQRILQLAEYIQNSDTFNPSQLLNLDGTPANIAGHAIHLFREDLEESFQISVREKFNQLTKDSLYEHRRFMGDWKGFKKRYGGTFSESLYYLGLTRKQGVQLYAFYPMDRPPTKKEVVTTLRCLAETGEVVWVFS